MSQKNIWSNGQVIFFLMFPLFFVLMTKLYQPNGNVFDDIEGSLRRIEYLSDMSYTFSFINQVLNAVILITLLIFACVLAEIRKKVQI